MVHGQRSGGVGIIDIGSRGSPHDILVFGHIDRDLRNVSITGIVGIVGIHIGLGAGQQDRRGSAPDLVAAGSRGRVLDIVVWLIIS